jgi:hypothetical protein
LKAMASDEATEGALGKSGQVVLQRGTQLIIKGPVYNPIKLLSIR